MVSAVKYDFIHFQLVNQYTNPLYLFILMFKLIFIGV